MFGLLIVIAAAAAGAVAAVILLVAWAVRREDACLTMTDPAPSRATRAVRRLLGLHSIGYDPDDTLGDWPGQRGPGPARWDTMAGV